MSSDARAVDRVLSVLETRRDQPSELMAGAYEIGRSVAHLPD